MNLLRRLEKIKSVEDIDKQLSLTKRYYMVLKNKIKNNKLTLDQKVQLNEKVKLAEQTLLNFRRIVFDVEDALSAHKDATSVLDKRGMYE